MLAIEDALKSSRAQGSTPFEKDECLTEIDKKLVNCNFECVSVMSGHVSVQARIKQKHPAVVYTDCIAHRLELAVLDSIKCDNYLKEFDKRINKIFYFHSPARRRTLHEIAKVLKDEFKQLSGIKNIRLIASRHGALNPLENDYKVLV